MASDSSEPPDTANEEVEVTMRRLIFALGLAAGFMIVLQAPWLTASDQTDRWGNRGGDFPQPMANTVYPWPMYTFNETHSSMTKSPSPDDFSVSWFNTTGQYAYGSPTIAEGKVFIGMGSPSGDSMMAFYINNGTRVWRHQTVSQVSGGMGVSSTPAYSNGVIFFAADKIYALYASNGNEKWTYPVPNTWWGGGTPTVAQGKVFVGAPDRYLYVLDENTGALVWRFLTQSSGGSNYGLFSPPAIWNNYVYLAGCDGYVYQINMTQSGPTASYYHRSAHFLEMYGSPLIFDGKVYIGDGYTGPDPNARFRALSATDLSVVWTFTPAPAGSFFSSAAVAYNKIFVGSTNGIFYALDPLNHNIIWSYDTTNTIWSSPAISDGKVFIGSESNYIYMFTANQTNPATYRFRYLLNGAVDSSPAISDGRVCVGTFGGGGRIYCFGSGMAPPVNNPPAISLTNPNGAQDWTGGFPQLIAWTMSDDTTPVGSLKVYLNYTSTPSSGTIAGPLMGATSFGWTVPPIDANDVRINATVIDGNGSKGYSTVLVPQIDSTSPVILSALPTGTGVALTAPVVVEFSERMNTASVEAAFTLVPNMGTMIFSWSQRIFPDDTLTIDHMDFFFSTTYTATVWTGARDISNPGNSLILEYIWSFTTIVDMPPTISITAPAGGESWTGSSVHNIAWTANDAEDPAASLKVWVNYSVTGGAPFNRQVADLQGASGTSSPYAWTVPLEDSVTVMLNATVMDTAGARGRDLSAIFEIDSTAPTITVVNPWSGATGVPTGANIVVIWSEWMNATSVESAFSLKDTITWTRVPGAFSWVGTIMTFDPISLLSAGTQYSANITVSAKDDSQPGNNLASLYIWTFTTNATADTTKPTLMDATAIPDPQEVYLPVNVSAIVQDDVAVGLVRLNVTDPVGGTTNTTMQYDPVAGRYYVERGYGSLGVFAFDIWASDTSGNWNVTSGQFTVADTTAPIISDLRAMPDPVAVFSQTDLSAIVTDNYQLANVWVEITAPDLTATNQTMSPGARYHFAATANQLGTYTFRVSAVDSVGLWDTASSTFTSVDINPPVIDHTPRLSWIITGVINITANVTDNFQVQEVWLDFTDTSGAHHNVSMTHSQQDEYFYVVPTQAQVGTLNYHFWAVDQSGNGAASAQYSTSIVTSADLTPPVIDHTPRSSWMITAVINITANVTDNVQVQEVWLNFTDTAGTPHNISMVHSQQDEYFYIVPTQAQAGTLTYHFWALDTSGNGAASTQYSTSILESKPDSPIPLVATLAACNSVHLQWVAPTTNEDGSPLSDLAGYNVYRSGVAGTQGVRLNADLVQGTTYLDSDLPNNVTYYYTVRAVNSQAVESELSNEAYAITAVTCGSNVPGDTSWLLWVVALLVIVLTVVILIVAVMLMKRRKRGELTEQQSKRASEEGKTDEGKKAK